MSELERLSDLVRCFCTSAATSPDHHGVICEAHRILRDLDDLLADATVVLSGEFPEERRQRVLDKIRGVLL